MQLQKSRERKEKERKGMEGWKDGRMEGWKDGRMERWKDGRMEGWKDGKMERWKDGKMETRNKKNRMQKERETKKRAKCG